MESSQDFSIVELQSTSQMFVNTHYMKICPLTNFLIQLVVQFIQNPIKSQFGAQTPQICSRNVTLFQQHIIQKTTTIKENNLRPQFVKEKNNCKECKECGLDTRNESAQTNCYFAGTQIILKLLKFELSMYIRYLLPGKTRFLKTRFLKNYVCYFIKV